MLIKQDPVTGLWAREDGAVLMPPDGYRFKEYRWTFGTKANRQGYLAVRYKGKVYLVHQIICRAFHGLPPADKPETDHINRIKVDNSFRNLRWLDRKGNTDNRDYVDKSLEKHGVRHCDDPKTYDKIHGKAYYETHREEIRAYQKGHAAALRAEKKAQGLAQRKDSTGKWGWFPRIRKGGGA